VSYTQSLNESFCSYKSKYNFQHFTFQGGIEQNAPLRNDLQIFDDLIFQL